ncbi:MAG: hypothetical protein IT330_00275 [Anaerolineae bacterium]|nr:hypothetical protein [Anaerolineae bacterium]
MKKTLLLSLLLVGVLLISSVTSALAAPGGVTDPNVLKELAAVRRATAKYHAVSVAEADGYVSTVDCVASPAGGMGIHYVNFGLFSDQALNPLAPEVLLYAPRANGVKLVAVEYVQVALANTPTGPAPWFDPAPPPLGWYNPVPSLFGQTFVGPMPGHFPGMPWHTELHVWVWQGNPAGIFAEFNPNVRCP